MGTLPEPGDVLYDVSDLIARTIALREAIEAGYLGVARKVARQLEVDAHALGERLRREAMQRTAAECGFEHISGLVGAELERLGGDAA